MRIAAVEKYKDVIAFIQGQSDSESIDAPKEKRSMLSEHHVENRKKALNHICNIQNRTECEMASVWKQSVKKTAWRTSDMPATEMYGTARITGKSVGYH